MTGVETVAVEEADSGIRLDRWFRRHFPALGHGRLEKLLRTGQVRVDGRRAKASTRLVAGQTIRIPPLGQAARAAPTSRPAVPPDDAAFIRSLVLYRDDHVIAINKPPGLAVQGGSRVARHVDAMLDALRFESDERPRLVHRLDKDTGGLLVLARSARSAAALANAFRSRDAHKTYWALVAGVPRQRQGRIDAPLVKAGANHERMVTDRDGGRRAITDYVVLEAAGRKIAWLALHPVTGRTHQLRVHCAALGTPILGDGKYGGRDAFIDGVPGGNRLHLHARALELPHPAGGRLELVAPLGDTMAEGWRFFGFDPEATVG